jgi:16S rRNA (guanine1207-N2)-methyltransferase
VTRTDIASLRGDIVFIEKIRGHELTLHSTWGLFSPKQIDEGTSLLLKYLELTPNATVLDLGCGYGALGLAAAKLLAPEGAVDLVDKDFVAVAYAAKNATLNALTNATAYLSNGFSAVPEGRTFDVIVSNLPAKIGGELLSIFLADARARLRPRGRLYVVTISGLKDYIKRHFTDEFGNYKKLGQSKTYTVAMAEKR